MATDAAIAAERDRAVRTAMDDIRRIEADHRDDDRDDDRDHRADRGVTRAGVEAIRDRLIALSSRRELFPSADFPAPADGDGESSYMYRLAQDADDRFALYAQSSRGHVETPPHNHTTWAVVVGHAGHEHNRFYERTSDGVAEIGRHTVAAGTGVAMLADDLHSIHIDGPALNFHCYGLALERLDSREYFNAAERRWKIFRATSGIREARAGLAC